MSENNLIFAVGPDAFLGFDNGLTLLKDYKYKRFNQAGVFIENNALLTRHFTRLFVRVLLTYENTVVIDTSLDKLQIGFRFFVYDKDASLDTIYNSALNQLNSMQYNIPNPLRCIGVLRDLDVGNDTELVFISQLKTPPNTLTMASDAMRKQLLAFDQHSRFILEKIDYIV